MLVTIYLLTFHGSPYGDLYYLGGTTNPARRREQHYTQLLTTTHPSRRCREAFALTGGLPSFTVLAVGDCGTPEEAAKLETEWLGRYFAASPWQLCNRARVADPGGYAAGWPISTTDLSWSAIG